MTDDQIIESLVKELEKEKDFDDLKAYVALKMQGSKADLNSSLLTYLLKNWDDLTKEDKKENPWLNLGLMVLDFAFPFVSKQAVKLVGKFAEGILNKLVPPNSPQKVKEVSKKIKEKAEGKAKSLLGKGKTLLANKMKSGVKYEGEEKAEEVSQFIKFIFDSYSKSVNDLTDKIYGENGYPKMTNNPENYLFLKLLAEEFNLRIRQYHALSSYFDEKIKFYFDAYKEKIRKIGKKESKRRQGMKTFFVGYFDYTINDPTTGKPKKGGDTNLGLGLFSVQISGNSFIKDQWVGNLLYGTGPTYYGYIRNRRIIKFPGGYYEVRVPVTLENNFDDELIKEFAKIKQVEKFGTGYPHRLKKFIDNILDVSAEYEFYTHKYDAFKYEITSVMKLNNGNSFPDDINYYTTKI